MDESMTFHDLQAWQASMHFTTTAAAAALGITGNAFRSLANGKFPIDKRTALACAAIAADIGPWRVQYELETLPAASPQLSTAPPSTN